VNLAVITAFLLSYSRHGVGFGLFRIDLAAYRTGGQAWLRGDDLYGQAPVIHGLSLPFTYPPIAAVLLAPLALAAMTPAGTLLTLGSIGVAALVLRVFVRRLGGAAGGSARVVGWLLPAALLLEPLRSTLAYGQVNLVLMALVALDCLVSAPRWPRGALTGLAAAVKLTPAAFVLFFLLRKDYRAAATAGVSFAAATAAGFALAPRDSVRYWTAAVFQTGRVGDPAHAANQCLQAVLARAGLPPHGPAGVAAWLALSALVALLTWRGMRRALAAAQDCLALALNAFAALLISPMSWSHHWVWCAPALLALAGLARRRRRGPAASTAFGLAACGLVVFAVGPQWWLGKYGGQELNWAAWQQVLGNSYVIFAVAVLLLVPALLPRAALNSTALASTTLTSTTGREPGVVGGDDQLGTVPGAELGEQPPERGSGRDANSSISRLVTAGASSASPPDTTRMACSSSAGGRSLSRKPLAPARSARYTNSSAPNVVSMTTRVPGLSTMMRRVASIPSTRGILMSITATSGLVRAAASAAAAPSPASATTRRSSALSTSTRNPARTSSWSSAISTLTLTAFPAAATPRPRSRARDAVVPP